MSSLSCFRVKLCGSRRPHGIVGALGKPMVLGKAHLEQRQKDDEKGILPFTVSYKSRQTYKAKWLNTV